MTVLVIADRLEGIELWGRPDVAVGGPKAGEEGEDEHFRRFHSANEVVYCRGSAKPARPGPEICNRYRSIIA
jgi:hypothetical protein